MRLTMTRSQIRCVYLAGSRRDAQHAAWLVMTHGVEIVFAESVLEAEAALSATRARVLLCDADFGAGHWRDALRMVQDDPAAVMILVLPRFDGPTWVDALQDGCFDVVLKPFEQSELCDSIEDAHRYSVMHRAPSHPRPVNGRPLLQRIRDALAR